MIFKKKMINDKSCYNNIEKDIYIYIYKYSVIIRMQEYRVSINGEIKGN